MQIFQDGEHATVVVGRLLEAEPLQDPANVGLERLEANARARAAIEVLERPSAISARTSSSRGVRPSSGLGSRELAKESIDDGLDR